LTHCNTKRKMLVVGPLVAADSESNLRTFRFSGAPCAASVGFDPLSLAVVGNVLVALPAAPVRLPRAFGHDDAPPGLRLRRSAPELA
jgi:hypothetical protein